MEFLAGILLGMFIMFFLENLILFALISRQDKTLMSKTAGDFLIDAGHAIKRTTPAFPNDK